ncbi:MAG: hypothetical protein M1838_004987 [Thelocarpon superellum]|nr:MAG: hypothetical protein M1838_004987 [Thelocarpon superellum]
MSTDDPCAKPEPEPELSSTDWVLTQWGGQTMAALGSLQKLYATLTTDEKSIHSPADESSSGPGPNSNAATDADQVAVDELAFVFGHREMSGWGSPREERRDFMFPDHIAIYLDRDLQTATSDQRTVFVTPTGMDTSPLQHIHQILAHHEPDHEKDNSLVEDRRDANGKVEQRVDVRVPSAEFRDDRLAARKLLDHRRLRRQVHDGGGQEGGNILGWPERLVMKWELGIEEHSGPLPSHSEVMDESALRESLQHRWRRKRQVGLAQERAQLKARLQQSEATGNAAERDATRLELRHLTRKRFDECIRDELRDVRDLLRADMRAPMDELEELHHLRDAMQYELLREHYGLDEVVDDVDRRHSDATRLVTADEACVGGQVDALASLLDMGLRTGAALDTRLNRLAAKDVSDPAERERVKAWRLGQPDALLYLSKASEDLQFLRDFSQTVVAGMANIEHQMSLLASHTLGLYIANQGCRLRMNDPESARMQCSGWSVGEIGSSLAW